MVNGRIARELSAAELGSDVALQERLLGLRSTRDDEEADPQPMRLLATQPATALSRC
jgi:hypothetical protein